MIANYTTYLQYFEALAQQLVGISAQADGSYVLIYESNRKLDDQRANSAYPCFEIKRPVIRPNYTIGGNHVRYFDTAISVLAYVDEEDYDAQEATMAAIEPIIQAAYNQLLADGLLPEGQVQIYPVANTELDGLYGWGFDVSLFTQSDFCEDPLGFPAVQIGNHWPVYLTEAPELGQVPKWDGNKWVPAADNEGGAAGALHQDQTEQTAADYYYYSWNIGGDTASWGAIRYDRATNDLLETEATLLNNPGQLQQPISLAEFENLTFA